MEKTKRLLCTNLLRDKVRGFNVLNKMIEFILSFSEVYLCCSKIQVSIQIQPCQQNLSCRIWILFVGKKLVTTFIRIDETPKKLF